MSVVICIDELYKQKKLRSGRIVCKSSKKLTGSDRGGKSI